jgi:molybdenum cofactor biosynthesis enzyme MoaA
MEFELSNLCNLECVMCNGRLSSSIRKRRDQLPAIPSPYDDEFVRQLEEFIPHLESARFNGGEPLLQKECLQIWERIIAIKPSIEITIATNGTVWSPKIEKLLKKGRFKINLSLDGMSAKTYESIRRNSDFKKVVANAARFSEYCVEAGTVFCIMYNPMRTNWHEIPDLIRFCNENGYHVWFNTIYRPFQLALWTLPSKELYKIYEELSHRSMPLHEDHSIAFGNTQKYHTFVHVQLKNWAKEQEEREKKDEDYRSKQLAKKNSKSFFLKKLESSVAETGRLSKIMNKLDFVEKGVSKNIQASDFYQLLNERPVDWVVHDLEKRSAEEVIEELYYRAEYY